MSLALNVRLLLYYYITMYNVYIYIYTRNTSFSRNKIVFIKWLDVNACARTPVSYAFLLFGFYFFSALQRFFASRGDTRTYNNENIKTIWGRKSIQILLYISVYTNNVGWSRGW
jgi:hypothetical protein